MYALLNISGERNNAWRPRHRCDRVAWIKHWKHFAIKTSMRSHRTPADNAKPQKRQPDPTHYKEGR